MKQLIIGYWWLVACVTSACFSPQFQDGKIACAPDGSCPPGLSCFAGICRSEAPDPDGATEDAPQWLDAAVDAPPGMVTLTVSTGGSGTGTITATGIDCPGDCTESYPMGTEITLIAGTDLATTDFVGWNGGGGCTGTTSTCTITLTADTAVGARFDLKKRTVTIVPGGNGTGTVTSNVGGINCPGTCSATVDHGTPIVLTAAASGTSSFLGWSGGSCSGTGPCTVTPTADVTINAPFALDFTLVVTRVGTGSANGTVMSSPAGISCGSDCSETYSSGTPVTLTASAGAETTFVGWEGGGCTGTAPCTVTINGAVSVPARFDLVKYPLTVSTTGMGTVSSTNIAGIGCPGDCSENYDSGTTVTLSASPTPGWSLASWGGACATATGSTCTVTMTQARSVSVTFAINTYPLSVTKTGAGTGNVTSSPAGINCVNGTGTCTANFNHGTMVTLTAVPAQGTTFAGWSGACTSSPCTVTMTQARSVTANFTVTNYTLSVNLPGNGEGVVTGTGINCGNGNTDCSETVPYNTTIALTATPATSSKFDGFVGGGCGASSPCSVTVTGNLIVEATFTLKQYTVTAVKAGTGMGMISATRAGTYVISNCNESSGDCTEVVDHGTMLTFNAAAATGSSFASWSGGGCTNANPCTTTPITADTTVTGTITLNSYVLTVNKTGSMTGGLGTVTSNPTGINCGTSCTSTTNSYPYNTSVVLTATPATGHRFLGWAGACTNTTGTCTVAMTAAKTVSAKFTNNLSCTFVSNALSCTNGSITNLSASLSTAAECRTYCENNMFAVGMTTGCWIHSGSNCYCRNGTLNTGGTSSGGVCTNP